MFSLMFRVALDVLPAQASAVPCERLFSSSAETITKRRNALSPAVVEALQHLKFTYRSQRMSFMEPTVTEEELGIPFEDVIPLTRDTARRFLDRANTPQGQDAFDLQLNTLDVAVQSLIPVIDETPAWLQ